MLRLFPAGPLFSGTSPGRAVLRGRALCAPKRLHRPAHRHGLGGVFPSRAASGEYWAGTSGTFRPRQAGLSLAAFPGVSPGGHPAARIGPQFPLRASHQRALTPHCTKQRAASAHCGCYAPLSLSRASVRFALQGVKPAFPFAFLFFARKDPLAPFRYISASRRHAPPAFFIFPPHAKAAARRQKQSLSLPQSSCPLRAGAAAGGCALHFGPGGSAG